MPYIVAQKYQWRTHTFECLCFHLCVWMLVHICAGMVYRELHCVFFFCYLECTLCIISQHPPSHQPTHHMETVTNKKKRKKVFLWISLVLSGRPDPAITLTVQPAFNAEETTVCIPSAHLTNHLLRKTTGASTRHYSNVHMTETMIHASLFQKDSNKCKPLENIREKLNDLCHGLDPISYDNILIDLHGKASTQVVR